jgi:hypothetical protein
MYGCALDCLNIRCPWNIQTSNYHSRINNNLNTSIFIKNIKYVA